MSDIVERLRYAHARDITDGLLRDAADEIAALEKVVEAARECDRGFSTERCRGDEDLTALWMNLRAAIRSLDEQRGEKGVEND